MLKRPQRIAFALAAAQLLGQALAPIAKADALDDIDRLCEGIGLGNPLAKTDPGWGKYQIPSSVPRAMRDGIRAACRDYSAVESKLDGIDSQNAARDSNNFKRSTPLLDRNFASKFATMNNAQAATAGENQQKADRIVRWIIQTYFKAGIPNFGG